MKYLPALCLALLLCLQAQASTQEDLDRSCCIVTIDPHVPLSDEDTLERGALQLPSAPLTWHLVDDLYGLIGEFLDPKPTGKNPSDCSQFALVNRRAAHSVCNARCQTADIRQALLKFLPLSGDDYFPGREPRQLARRLEWASSCNAAALKTIKIIADDLTHGDLRNKKSCGKKYPWFAPNYRGSPLVICAQRMCAASAKEEGKVLGAALEKLGKKIYLSPLTEVQGVCDLPQDAMYFATRFFSSSARGKIPKIFNHGTAGDDDPLSILYADDALGQAEQYVGAALVAEASRHIAESKSDEIWQSRAAIKIADFFISPLGILIGYGNSSKTQGIKFIADSSTHQTYEVLPFVAVYSVCLAEYVLAASGYVVGAGIGICSGKNQMNYENWIFTCAHRGSDSGRIGSRVLIAWPLGVSIGMVRLTLCAVRIVWNVMVGGVIFLVLSIPEQCGSGPNSSRQ